MTIDLEKIRDILKRWAAEAVNPYEAQAVYVFGSLVYKDGEQFMNSSDIDLVVVLPPLADAMERWRWQQRFSEAVADLEVALMRALKRDGLEPLVSVVAVTELELNFDVHKDGHREFFSANTFRDLVAGTDAVGITGAGTKDTDRFVAGALSLVQKVRNDFLAVSANETPRLTDYHGEDGVPKRIMRGAAMAARAIGETHGPGAEHDVREGLDLLSNELYARRKGEPPYRSLQDLVSVRRNGRGEIRPVDPSNQLLLAEIVYDLVTGKSSRVPGPSGNGGPSGSTAAPTPTTVSTPAVDSDAEVAATGSEGAEVTVDTRERMGTSTSFFAERFAAAFPGVLRISWFNEPDDIEQRMLALLKTPLAFPDGLPVWYWRGGNLQIESFRRLEPGLFLMDTDELKIARVAAIHGSTYKRHFVYVRCDAMPQTGLYQTSISDMDAAVRQSGYDYEEYGLVSGITAVKRSEYDDGAAVIDGRLTDLRGKSELRVRYTTPYNFLIAANGSPINNSRFDDVLVRHLNEALAGEEEEVAIIEKLRLLVEELPIRGDFNL